MKRLGELPTITIFANLLIRFIDGHQKYVSGHISKLAGKLIQLKLFRLVLGLLIITFFVLSSA